MAYDAEHLAGFNGHISGVKRGDRPAAYLIRLLYLVKYNHGQRLVGAALKPAIIAQTVGKPEFRNDSQCG